MYFVLVAVDGAAIWVRVYFVCYIYFVSSSGSTLGVGYVLYFTLVSLELCIYRVWDSVSLFGSWIVASTKFSNNQIALSW